MENVFHRIKRFAGKWIDLESSFFLKNSSWLFLDQGSRVVISFLGSIIIARGLGADLFGKYTILITLVATIQQFVNFNIGSAVIKFGAEYKAAGQFSKLALLVTGSYAFTALTAIASIGIVAISATLLYDLFFDVPGLNALLVIYAVGTAFSFLDALSKALLRLFYKFKINAVINVVMAFIELIVVAITLYFYPRDLFVLIIALAGTKALNAFICFGAAYWELRPELGPLSRPSWSDILDQGKEMWGFVLGTSGSNSLKRLVKRGDVLLLGILASSTEIAYYAIAKKLATSILAITDPLSYSIYPQLATLVSQGKLAQLKKMLRNVTVLLSLPFLAFILLAILLGEQIITLAYGVEFAGAGGALLFVLAATSVEAVLFWTVSLLNSFNLVAVRFKVYTVGALLGLLLAWLLVPSYGAAGMGVAILCMNLLIQASFAYVNLRAIHTHQPARPVAEPKELAESQENV